MGRGGSLRKPAIQRPNEEILEEGGHIGVRYAHPKWIDNEATFIAVIGLQQATPTMNRKSFITLSARNVRTINAVDSCRAFSNGRGQER